MKEAFDKGCNKISLNAWRTNDTMHCFCKKLGYKKKPAPLFSQVFEFFITNELYKKKNN